MRYKNFTCRLLVGCLMGGLLFAFDGPSNELIAQEPAKNAEDTVVSWPSFLGQGATELQPDKFPIEWEVPQALKWNVALPGHGQSSPVLWRWEKTFWSFASATKCLVSG